MKATYLLTGLIGFLFGVAIGSLGTLLVVKDSVQYTTVLNVQPTELDRLEYLETIAEHLQASEEEGE